MNNPDPLMTPEAVAEWLGVTVGVLANWRYLGAGPRFIRLGAKSIRYSRQEVESWLEENTHSQT